jgi:hypothetical protein
MRSAGSCLEVLAVMLKTMMWLNVLAEQLVAFPAFALLFGHESCLG